MEEYPYPMYPSYCQGAFYLLPLQIAEKLDSINVQPEPNKFLISDSMNAHSEPPNKFLVSGKRRKILQAR